MPSIDVDTERLGREAETLGTQRGRLNGARRDLETGCASAAAGCGHTADGGLAKALGHLKENWNFDLDEIGKDLDALTEVMRSLAQMYGAVDRENAETLRK